METIYYHLDAHKLSICAQGSQRQAAGGSETVHYAFVPHKRRAPIPQGENKVVDFSAYRQLHAAPVEDIPAQFTPPATQGALSPQPKTSRLALALDLCASAAILVTLAVFLVRFFAL